MRLSVQAYAGKPLQQRSEWYSSAAQVYARARPAYPETIIQHVVKHTGLTAGSRILEVGCGPGTATTAFAALGCRIDCIEPNTDFCAILRDVFLQNSDVSVFNQGFEDVDVDAGQYDVVLAATSFHWIPAAVAYPKARAALHPSGKLVLLWNKELFPDAATYQQLAACYTDIAPDLAHYQTEREQFDIFDQLAAMIDQSGCFKLVATERVVSDVAYSAEQYLQLLSSYSPYLKLDAGLRDILFKRIQQFIDQQLGGKIALRYYSASQIAMRIGCT
jgi:SAM-dependent methyltransferase